MSKKSAIVILLAIVVGIVGVGLLEVFGAQVGIYDIKPIGQAISLGLDLRGGVYVVYEASDEGVEDFSSRLASTQEILRNRLDAQGYTEATVSLQGTNRIRVEIPDVDDPAKVLEIIGTPAKLEFVGPDGEVILTGEQVTSAKAAYVSGEGSVVQFELNSEGAQAFAEATQANIGQVIRITLDGETISEPTVNTAITDGAGYINGSFTASSAQELAMLISSGALPLELTQLSLSTMSATLGVDALDRSIMAGLIGVICILIFMIVVYRLPGFIADMALLIYIMLVMFLLAVIPGVQLSLPGIAGIILGVGMAVDANVIIFERFKEELALGKTVRSACNSAFKKAFVTIIDSNITTLIAAFVLLFYGAGTIKGYAITLAIGIVASVFTAVFVTRFIMRLMIGMNITNPILYGLPRKKEAK